MAAVGPAGPPPLPIDPAALPAWDRITRGVGESLRMEADRVAQRLRGWGKDARSIALSGDPADRLIAAARDQAADLIVVGAHGRSGAAPAGLGAVAYQVSRCAPCAVLIARNAPERFERVLLAIADRSEPIVGFLERLPWNPGQLITVLCAAPAPPLLPDRPEGGDDSVDPGVAELGAALVAAARECVLDAAQGLALAGLGPSGLVRRGPAVDEILAAARDLEADLIVVGGRGRAGADGLLIGSVAARVVDRAPVTCLIVPPT